MSTETIADAQALMGRYEEMVRIRRFEEEVQRRFLKGEVPGTTHLCIGHEACSAGVGAALRPDDLVAATYRGHGHALARGIATEALAAEMLGKATGVNGGRSGSMNVVDLDHGLIGCFGIVGGTLAAATGAALALRGTGRVAVAFFGDGTANQAYWSECLNFAKVLQLPVLFVCEHNLYSEFMHWEQVTAGGDIVARVDALDIPTATIDGNDVEAVLAATERALEGVRAGSGPAYLELRTYRFVGHSRSDPGEYRIPGELDEWKLRDPLLVAAAELERRGVAPAEIEAAAVRTTDAVAAAFTAAAAAPLPDPDDVPEYCDA